MYFMARLLLKYGTRSVQTLRILELLGNWNKNPSKKKFDLREIKCTFVEYDALAKGYRV